MNALSIPTLAFLASSLLVPQGSAQTPRQAPPVPLPSLELVSRDSAGVQGNSWSGGAALSDDGRFVAFASISDNLVAGDTNASGDVFVADRVTGATERVSVDSSGLQAHGHSRAPSISGDGRIVAFESLADDLVPDDTNGFWGTDVFVHDRATGVTLLVSRSSAGEQSDGKSERPAVSADGRFVAFESYGTNLAPGTDGFVRHVYVHDLWTGETTLASLDHLGQPADANNHGTTISGDGRRVAFHSDAELVADDTNGRTDIFVRDRLAGATLRVSVDSSGEQGNSYSLRPSISRDGRFVAFQSGSELVPGDDDGFFDVYVHDLLAGETMAVTALDPTLPAGHLGSARPSISGDGQLVAFQIAFGDLKEGRVEVYLHDRASAVSKHLSRGLAPRSDGDSAEPAISADGRAVGFESVASDLVEGDENGAADVFVHAGY